jgi:hypothetical protein
MEVDESSDAKKEVQLSGSKLPSEDTYMMQVISVALLAVHHNVKNALLI